MGDISEDHQMISLKMSARMICLNEANGFKESLVLNKLHGIPIRRMNHKCLLYSHFVITNPLFRKKCGRAEKIRKEPPSGWFFLNYDITNKSHDLKFQMISCQPSISDKSATNTVKLTINFKRTAICHRNQKFSFVVHFGLIVALRH